MTEMKLLQIIMSLILPPVGVALVKGINRDFVINLLLTIFFFVPGMIHALYLVATDTKS